MASSNVTHTTRFETFINSNNNSSSSHANSTMQPTLNLRRLVAADKSQLKVVDNDNNDDDDAYDSPYRDESQDSFADKATAQVKKMAPLRRQLERTNSSSYNQTQELDTETVDQLDTAAGSKQHVGPVMGIFFKVWSLVKVTKARHNKMRRQNSDDATQFQFVSGEQLAPSSGAHLNNNNQSNGNNNNNNFQPQQRRRQQQQAYLHYSSTAAQSSAHVLRDGHFRRADSQPPLSTTSTTSAQVNHLTNNEQTTTKQPPRRVLQSLTLSNELHATSATGGTSGSSSGVSSATSSTLGGGGGGSTATCSAPLRVVEQMGVYAQKLTTTNSPTGKKRQLLLATRDGSDAKQRQHKETSGMSYMARCKNFRRAADRQSQAAMSTTGGDKNRFNQQHDESRRRALVGAKKSAGGASILSLAARVRAQPARLMRRFNSESDDDEDDDDYDYDDDDDEDGDKGQVEDEQQRQAANNNNNNDDDVVRNAARLRHSDAEDSDLNDIYSTPNDSIQSVPGTHALQENSNNHIHFSHQQSQQRRASAGSFRSIVKSFSTNNFDQRLLNGNVSVSQHGRRFDPIEESNKLLFKEASCLNKQKELENTRSSGEQSQNHERISSSSSSSSRLMNGSRFFVSSSSSEDSAGPTSAPVPTPKPIIDAATTTTTTSLIQEKNLFNTKIPLQFGLHYHEPLALQLCSTLNQRPNSLQLQADSSLLKQQYNGDKSRRVNIADNSQVTPQPSCGANNTVKFECQQVSEQLNQVALMSPMTPTTNNNLINSLQSPPVVLDASIKPNTPLVGNYKKSPSLFEMQHSTKRLVCGSAVTRFSSKYPMNIQDQQSTICQPNSFLGHHYNQTSQVFNGAGETQQTRNRHLQNFHQTPKQFHLPNSVSLYDCKLTSAPCALVKPTKVISQVHKATSSLVNQREAPAKEAQQHNKLDNTTSMSAYKLAQILLESGSNSSARDTSGYTALMHAILSENIAAIKCLIEHGIDLNAVNNENMSALDIVCSKPPTQVQLEMLKLLIDNQVDLDKSRASDGTRLLDRLIGEHTPHDNDKLPYIDCLLHNGAKLGSATWIAANNKREIQLRLLRKLCQDGYFLYKESSIEAAVYRFEYALKRIGELEQQLVSSCCKPTIDNFSAVVASSNLLDAIDQATVQATQQIKYQTYLGLSRCERKRKFFKRALEFAHMTILVDSTSYEGYYSKAHILKDIGELNEALIAIDQTDRLVDRSIELIKSELDELRNQEESIVFDGCFNVHNPGKSCWIEMNRTELLNNLDYLDEAKKHILRLRSEILNDKEDSCRTEVGSSMLRSIDPIST